MHESRQNPMDTLSGVTSNGDQRRKPSDPMEMSAKIEHETVTSTCERYIWVLDVTRIIEPRLISRKSIATIRRQHDQEYTPEVTTSGRVICERLTWNDERLVRAYGVDVPHGGAGGARGARVRCGARGLRPVGRAGFAVDGSGTVRRNENDERTAVTDHYAPATLTVDMFENSRLEWTKKCWQGCQSRAGRRRRRFFLAATNLWWNRWRGMLEEFSNI